MNFKTTLTLLIALVVIGGIVLFRGKPSEEPASAGPQKLLAVSSESVNGITVTPASGEAIALSRDDKGDWQLTKPVTAAAEKFEVDDLVRAVTSLETRGQVDVAPALGFDKPQYTIILHAGDKTHEIVIGAASAVGENLYVKVDGAAKADIVSADLLRQLESPVTKYRVAKLAPESSNDIRQVTITQDGQTLALARQGDKWSVVAPTSMPADTAAVNEVLSAVTGLRAEDFVSEGSDTEALGQPRLTISYSTEAPTTQPATTQPAIKTIVFGRYSDISKKSVLATSPAVGAVVKVAATSLDAFDKKPIELRDKQVLTLDTNRVGSVELTVDSAATTQPTTKPASTKKYTVTRRPPPATQPTTVATTQPATTQAAATQPLSKWVVAGDAPANDAAVDAILSALSPLRAEKYIESAPVVATPVATYKLTVVVPASGPSLGERHELTVLDFGGDDTSPVATYNGLTFNVSRSLLTALQADLSKQP